MSQSYGVAAYLTIRAPLGSYQPAIITDRDLGRLVKRITVSNALTGTPGGSFQIELAPGAAGGVYDEDLGEIIEPRSLVEIAIHRYAVGDDLFATKEPVVLMVGIVDYVDSPQDWSQRDPMRRVTLTGRSLAGLLVDHKWWFHNFLAREGLLQDVPEDIRRLAAVKLVDGALRDEQNLRDLGFLAIDDELYSPAERDPVGLLQRTYDFFVAGYKGKDGTQREPFIKLRFSDDAPLSSRLVFDAAAARQRWFDPAAKLIQQFLPTQMPNIGGWDVLRYFCEDHFTELFADANGAMGDGHVQIIARKPPWLGRVIYWGGQAYLDFNGRDAPRVGQSLFEDGTATVYFDGNDLKARPRLTRGLGASDAFSIYAVRPGGLKNLGTGHGMLTWDQLIPPVIDEDPASPSFVQRIGLRPLNHTTRYIPVVVEDDQTPRAAANVRGQCLAYAALLLAWNKWNPAAWNGSLSLKGNTAIRVGTRLVDRTRPREYYVTAVRHEIRMDGKVTFDTTASVARGWTLQPGTL